MTVSSCSAARNAALSVRASRIVEGRAFARGGSTTCTSMRVNLAGERVGLHPQFVEVDGVEEVPDDRGQLLPGPLGHVVGAFVRLEREGELPVRVHAVEGPGPVQAFL